MMFKVLITISFLLISIVNAKDFYSEKKIKEMISKMVILGFKGEDLNNRDKIYKNIKSGLGGVILFDKDPTNNRKIKNIRNPEQLKKLTKKLQNISKRKLFIAIDQEGGIVQRMKKTNGFFDTLSAKEISSKDEQFAKNQYSKLAKLLKENGLNLNFAPVVDMALNKNNKVIYKLKRSYSNNPDKVFKYASIFVNELKKSNIYSVLKHFPGHGSSLADSHKGFVDITKTWNKKELNPYIDFINANNVDMIMTAHVFNKNLDKNFPATLSYNINTKLLRNKLGFKGVLITDDLQMRAISKHYSLKDSLTLAINSGVNMLLFANQEVKEITLENIVNTVYKQILDKKISLDKIIQSNKKIDNLLEQSI